MEKPSCTWDNVSHVVKAEGMLMMDLLLKMRRNMRASQCRRMQKYVSVLQLAGLRVTI